MKITGLKMLAIIIFVMMILSSNVIFAQNERGKGNEKDNPENKKADSKNPDVKKDKPIKKDLNPDPSTGKDAKIDSNNNTNNSSSEIVGKNENDLSRKVDGLEKKVSGFEADAAKSKWEFFSLSTILYALVGFLILGAAIFIFYFIFDSIKRHRLITEQNFKAVKSKQTQMTTEVEALKQTVNTLSGQVTQQQQSISSLKRKLGEVDNYVPPMPQNYASSLPKAEFPTSAEEYIAKSRSQATIATLDSFTGLLIEDSTKSSEFLLVKSGNIMYAIPSITRFSTKSDYLNFYQRFYRCDRPAGGEVWIKSPTKVQKTQSGWQVSEQGELEIR
jgi:hypothetical protein